MRDALKVEIRERIRKLSTGRRSKLRLVLTRPNCRKPNGELGHVCHERGVRAFCSWLNTPRHHGYYWLGDARGQTRASLLAMLEEFETSLEIERALR